MIKLLIFIALCYLGYRLFVGPPLLKGRNTPLNDRKQDEDDDYAEYEEIK